MPSDEEAKESIEKEPSLVFLADMLGEELVVMKAHGVQMDSDHDLRAVGEILAGEIFYAFKVTPK